MNIGQNIKRIRESKKMTQDKLASMLGYSHKSSINKIEMGKADISATKLVELANALEVSPNEILRFDLGNSNSQLNSEPNDYIDAVAKIYGEDAVSLIKQYDSLNEIGKSKISEMMDDLMKIDKYIKKQGD
ncbi:MAG: helix-turn-helix transcriptional regulator [Clostridia bacterium]|nr:helix-turn-helix transcriptional regulator [Clostridia bacterium]